MKGSRSKGVITDWNDARGFGFIVPADGGVRVFCHVSAFDDRSTRPANGSRVTYELDRDQQGRPRANRVRDSLVPLQAIGHEVSVPHAGRALFTSLLFIAAVWALSATGFLHRYFAWLYLIASALAVFLYWLDKAAAQRSDQRTPEATLQLLALFGGWPGAWVAQQWFRHKTRKKSFQVVFWSCVALNCTALAVLLVSW